MQKETLIAVVVGLTLGLFVTYGLYQFKQSITTPPVSEVDVKKEKPVENKPKSNLLINSPEDGLVQTQTEATVSGQTAKPNSYVVVFVGNDETILQSDASGNFSTQVDLADGANVITIIGIDQDGQTTTEERVVAVTSIFEQTSDQKTNEQTQEEAETATASEATQTAKEETADEKIETTESTTEAILERINKKLSKEQQEELSKTIEQLAIKREAVIGQVERVAEEALTISTTEGTVILPIDENTTISKNDKNIDTTKIEVGNWLLVMGTVDDDSIKPEQIVVNSKSLRPKPQLVMIGSISEVGKNNITLTNRADSKQIELNFDKNTNFEDLDGKTAKLANFSQDLTVLTVGYEEKDDKKTTKLLTTVRALAAFEK